MPEPQKIVFLYRVGHTPDLIIEKAKADVPDGFTLTFSPAEDSDETRRALVAEADYIIDYGRPFDDIDIAKNVKLFQVLSAGFDRLDLNVFNKAGIPVCNNAGANAPTVAEHAIMLMLAVYKKLPLHHGGLQNGKWIGHEHALVMRELRNKQVGIIGFGKIGQELARIANGFLATVAFYDVFDAPQELKEEFSATQMTLPELLKTSDVISVHTPLTETTRGMMNKKTFAQMKSSAIFITTARGEVTVEADLIEALDKGIIAGAGIDVFEQEPTPTDNPLFGRDNVVVTPHMAGTTIDTWARRLEIAFTNVQRVSKGETPLAMVNDPQ